MNRTRLGILFIGLAVILVRMAGAPAWGGEVVVVRSASLAPYNQALRGIEDEVARDVPARGPKSVTAHTLHSHLLSEAENPGQLRKDIQHRKPDCILVIGSSSLSLVKGITDIPVVYLMVPFPELLAGGQDNITGVDMNIGPDRELEQLTRTAPRVKQVGLLYDPDRTGRFVQKAREFADRNNLSLFALPVQEASEVPGGLEQFKGRIDWFWMVPDLTVLTPQTVDFIMLFSLENRIPVLTFSDKYLDLGAVLSISTDPYDMGRQAAELALKIMSGQEDAGQPPERVRKVVVRTNREAARMLGVYLQETTDGE